MMGSTGERVAVTLSSAELLNPSSTASPAPTATAVPTATPIPAFTAVPTATSTPTPVVVTATPTPAPKLRMLLDSTHGQHDLVFQTISRLMREWGYSPEVNDLTFVDTYINATEADIPGHTYTVDVSAPISLLGVRVQSNSKGGLAIQATSPSGEPIPLYGDTIFADQIVNAFIPEPEEGLWSITIERRFDDEPVLSYNLELGAVDETIALGDLHDYESLVLINPRLAFVPNEVTAILNYVKEGGSLFFIGEYVPAANSLAENTDVLFNADGIIDPTDNLGPGYEWRPIIHTFEPHPTTIDVNQVAVIAGNTLTISNPDAIVVAKGDEDSYSRRYPEGTYPPVSAALAYGEGRIFFHNDAGLFLDLNDNYLFANNIIDWLAEAAPAPTSSTSAPTAVFVTATPTPTSVPLPPQPQEPRGTLNVIDDLGNEQWLLRNAVGETPLWYLGEPLVWWDWEVDGPTNEAILESWEFTENADDSVDWTLNIRPGVTFHKGWGEVTSTDIKFAFTDMLQEGTSNPNRGFFSNFYGSNPDNIDDSDPLVLRVHQPEKSNIIEQFRVFSAEETRGIRPYPKAYMDQVGEAEFAQRPIYAGPYEFTSQQQGFDLVLTAVPDHYRVTPGFETIHYFKILDLATKVAALRTGQIDITTLLPKLVKGVEAAGIKIALSKNAIELFVNFGGLYPTSPNYNPNFPWTTNNPLGGSAVEVRKALNYAIDRQAILDKILFGFGEIGIISFGFNSATAGPDGGPPPWWNDAWEPHPFNPALARQILADAGHAGCFEFNMWQVFGLVYSRDIGEAVASMWEENLSCRVDCRLAEYRPNLRGMLLDQSSHGWAIAFDGFPVPRPQRYACLHGGPVGGSIIQFSTLAFFTSLCSISDKSLDPVEIANIERQIGDQQYRVFNTAAIASVHIPIGVGPKVKSWVPMPKKSSGLGLLEFAQPA